MARSDATPHKARPAWSCTLNTTTVLLAIAISASTSERARSATPLNDLGPGLYLNQFQGGLYPNGSNNPPVVHAAEGVNRALAIQPLNTAGQPDPTGKYVLVSIGMSNTTQEFCSQNSLAPCDAWTFMGQAAADPAVNDTSLFIVNGAHGGRSAAYWDSPTDPDYDRIVTDWLAPNGLSEQQVQAAWVKVANPQPANSLPNANSDAYRLVDQMGDIARALKVRYPNLQQVFFSSRIYAGYASTQLNPEPYAYESGLAVKWLIEAQIDQVNGGGVDPLAGDLNYNSGIAPWLAWGPYLWADGLNPRSDGLIWQQSSFQNDGTHPSQSGEAKVGTMLLDFMSNSPFTMPWFLSSSPGDFNDDDTVDAADYVVWRKTDGTQIGYDTWRANFGAMAGSGAHAGGSASAAGSVPEPATLVILMLAAAGWCLRRGRAAEKSTIKSLTRDTR
jgi:hypothetical protein